MELRLATTDDIIQELMQRPLRFVFFGNERTNSPRPRLVCGAGKISSLEEFEELVDQARDWLEAALEADGEEEITMEVRSENGDVPGSDSLSVHELLTTPLGAHVVLVSEEAIVALRSFLRELGVADINCVRIRWTDEGAELAVDEQQPEDVVLEHEGHVLLAMDSDSVRACAGRVLHFDASEGCFVWVRTSGQ